MLLSLNSKSHLQLILETGEIGRQANAAIMIRDGETVIFVKVLTEEIEEGQAFCW